MKRIKQTLSIIALSIIALSLSSCVSNDAKEVENRLYSKYNKEFEVVKIYDITPGGKGMNYDAICYPKDNQDLLFEAHVYNEGEEIDDEYECALLGEAMKRDAEPIINEIAEDYEMHMGFTSYADGFREGMSAKEFNMNNECVCYNTLIINKDKRANIEPIKLYSTITEMYREWGNINGGIYILLANNDEMIDIREQLSRKTSMDSNVFDVCAQQYSSDVKNGIVTKSMNEMFKDLK